MPRLISGPRGYRSHGSTRSEPTRHRIRVITESANCPSCGAENMLPGRGESIHCANCGAYLAREDGLFDHDRFIIVPEKFAGTALGEVCLSESEAKDMWSRNHPEYHATVAQCSHCNAAITTLNARFCPNCGWNLVSQVKDLALPSPVSKPKKRSPVLPSSWRKDKCMVCNLEFDRKDDIVFCPRCGKLAHRDHFFSWISKRGTCPICGEHLNPQDYQ